MKRACISLVLLLSGVPAAMSNPDSGIVPFVDPRIGVNGGGNVLIGPCQPFSIVRMNPHMEKPHITSGYKIGARITGFTVTGVSGTGGGGRYGNFCVYPQSGELDPSKRLSEVADEMAELGYYAANLTAERVKAELTSTEKVGYMRFTFGPQAAKHILLDMTSVIDRFRSRPSDGRCVVAYGAMNDDGLIEGQGVFQGGWGHNKPYILYFSAKTDVPCSAFGAFKGGETLPGMRVITGDNCGFYMTFSDSQPQVITVKIAVSTLSVGKAREHLLRSGDMDFRQALEENRATWLKYLDRFRIEGGTQKQRTLFYTSLYRTLVMPTDVTGENPQWQNSEPHFWDYYCIWDTFRTVFPLLSIAYPSQYVNMIRSLIDIYDHEGWLPDAWVVGGIARQQGGTNADVVIAEAMAKGIKGFDYDKAYLAVKKNATVPADESWDNYQSVMAGKHASYMENGYVPAHRISCVSHTLEYAYNDYCMSRIAAKMGHREEAEVYARRSMNCYNLFDSRTGFFWAKTEQGEWAENFSPTFMDKSVTNRYYYEGTPWHYAMYVPHDFAGLIRRHGGARAFEAKLDSMFIGKYYTQSNEPDIHVPYLYNYVGAQHRTAEVVRSLLSTRYSTRRAGLPGNDDSGCMSSWYIFSAMGFYPIAGQSFYLIGSPVFDKVTIALENGKKFIVQAVNNSEANKYIQRAYLNGRALDRSWIDHSEIARGGVLRFEMGDKPSGWASDCQMPIPM